MSVVGLQSPNRLPFTVLRNRVRMDPDSVTVGISSLLNPDTLSVPDLPMASNPADTTSAVMRSTVRMAESAILTVDLMTAEVVSAGFDAIGKSGTLRVSGFNKLEIPTVTLSGSILTLFRKTVKGSLFGDCNPTTDIPKILGLYQAGDLKLDEIITRTYTLEEVNEGYDDLMAGKNVRGVIIHEH